jgi:mono/diheme cytochrome c family protein
MLGFETPNVRVAVHSIAGSFVYAVLATKLLVTRETRRFVPAGRGAMPAGVVEGQDAADVAAYVATLSQ